MVTISLSERFFNQMAEDMYNGKFVTMVEYPENKDDFMSPTAYAFTEENGTLSLLRYIPIEDRVEYIENYLEE